MQGKKKRESNNLKAERKTKKKWKIGVKVL